MAEPQDAKQDSEELDNALLTALVEGFRARAGTKERFQALSEYELARRIGIMDYSYVEYDSSPEREQIRSALSRLQRRGLVRSASVTGRYETFLPSTQVSEAAEPHVNQPEGEPSVSASAELMRTSFEGRLDEMIRLLRSIDAHLERIERS